MKNIQDFDLKGKTVVLRCDFNVPLKDGQIEDDSKIVKSLKTINYVLDNGGKLVLLSHLGRVKSEDDKKKNTLKPVAEYLTRVLKKDVNFYESVKDDSYKESIKALPEGSIVLLENTRYEDFPVKNESSNNQDLAKYFASLGDIFCLDAFGSAHRAHASTAGIGSFIPYCMGFLMQEELENLSYIAGKPARPFTIMMGGAKIDDKIALINALLPKCDYFLATGGIANSFLNALGFNVGASIKSDSDNIIVELQKMMLNYKKKILLPLDVTVASTYDEKYLKHKNIQNVNDNDIIYDIGNLTCKKYKIAFDRSKTIFVNGTCGLYEDPRFVNGTIQCFNNMASSTADVYVGGGDSVAAAKKLGFADKFKYLSSGGGASLEYLGEGKLGALEYLKEHGYEETAA